MASLNAGATVTLTMGADDSVSVQVPSGASCIVEQPVGTRIAVVGSGSQAFGPFASGTQVKLTAEGQAIGYDSLDGTASPYLSESQSAGLKPLVSGGGSITAAELLTTTGTVGQTVRLTDGPDKGAILMWSTPAGSSTPKWCWWLWPQAAY